MTMTTTTLVRQQPRKAAPQSSAGVNKPASPTRGTGRGGSASSRPLPPPLSSKQALPASNAV